MRALPASLLALSLVACHDDAPPSTGSPAAARSAPRAVELTAIDDEARAPALRALVLGDWGTGGPGQLLVAEGIARWHATRPFTLGVTVGDNFYPRGVDTPDHPWFGERFRDRYGAVGVSFIVSLGNHDHLGDVDAQIAYGARDPTWVLPARFHRQERVLDDGTTVALVVLDTDTLRRTGEPLQLAFLDEALARPATWRVVVGHHPIYGHSVYGTDAGLEALLLPHLVDGRADFYLAGHEHTLEVTGPRRGLVHVVAGGGGGPEMARKIMSADDDTQAITGGGFVELTFTARRATVVLVDAAGQAGAARAFDRPARAATPDVPSTTLP